jgi:hypothetical protein
MFSCDVDCALIILQLNSPIHTVTFGSAITFPHPHFFVVVGVKFYSLAFSMVLWRWVLGGGIEVPCTVNPLYDGLTAEGEASKAAGAIISEAMSIRPLGLAVAEQLP